MLLEGYEGRTDALKINGATRGATRKFNPEGHGREGANHNFPQKSAGRSYWVGKEMNAKKSTVPLNNLKALGEV